MSIEALSRQFAEHSTQVVAMANSVEANRKVIDDLALKVAALMVGGNGGKTAEDSRAAELKAMSSFIRRGDDRALREIRAGAQMSGDSDPEGGYFDVPTVSTGMTKRLRDSVVMRRLARVETITSGSTWCEPIDIGDVEVAWVGERQPRSPTSAPEIGELSITLREVTSNVPITQNLLDDAGFNLGAYVEGKVTDKFSRAEDTAFMTGDGVLQPRGLLTYPTSSAADATRPWGTLQYVPTGAAADLASSDPVDALKNLAWAVRAPYRQGATWLMNSNTAAKLDKIKTGDGDYIWKTGMSGGTPSTLLGYPVEFSESMPDLGANAYPVAFGNFRMAYVIVDRAGIKFLRDPFSNKPFVMFYTTKRVGAGLANSEAVKLLKVAVS